MGNQESVPANPGLIKKKKVKPKQKPTHRKPTNNIQNNNTHKIINQNNKNNCNLNENGKKLLQRQNIPIPKKDEYNDFSNYNYELKSKNTDLNDSLVNRTMIQNKISYN